MQAAQRMWTFATQKEEKNLPQEVTGLGTCDPELK